EPEWVPPRRVVLRVLRREVLQPDFQLARVERARLLHALLGRSRSIRRLWTGRGRVTWPEHRQRVSGYDRAKREGEPWTRAARRVGRRLSFHWPPSGNRSRSGH